MAFRTFFDKNQQRYQENSICWFQISYKCLYDEQSFNSKLFFFLSHQGVVPSAFSIRFNQEFKARSTQTLVSSTMVRIVPDDREGKEV